MRRTIVLALALTAMLVCVPSAGAASLHGIAKQMQVGHPPKTVTYLSEIRYTAAPGEVNVLDYASTNPVYFSQCGPFEGPSRCIDVSVGRQAHHFVDGRGRLWWGDGFCKAPHPRFGTCDGQSVGTSLVMTLVLGDGNDELRVPATTSSPMRRIQVWAGAGNDVIRLRDSSKSWCCNYIDARERISCGPGTDEVVTRKDAIVSDDCEKVTRI